MEILILTLPERENAITADSCLMEYEIRCLPKVNLEYSLELLDFWTLPIARNSKYLENTTLWKLGLFLSSGEGKETPTLIGPLERANLNHWRDPTE
jgi:hypothetical protein